MSTNSKAQLQTATAVPIYKICDLNDKTFPTNFERYHPTSEEEDDEDQNNEDENEEEEEEQEEDEDEEEEGHDPNYSDESNSDESDDSDDIDIDLGYGGDNDEPSGFAVPGLFQNPIIFYRGYATQNELDQHKLSLSLVKGL